MEATFAVLREFLASVGIKDRVIKDSSFPMVRFKDRGDRWLCEATAFCGVVAIWAIVPLRVTTDAGLLAVTKELATANNWSMMGAWTIWSNGEVRFLTYSPVERGRLGHRFLFDQLRWQEALFPEVGVKVFGIIEDLEGSDNLVDW